VFQGYHMTERRCGGKASSRCAGSPAERGDGGGAVALIQMNVGRELCRWLRATDERLFAAEMSAEPPTVTFERVKRPGSGQVNALQHLPAAHCLST